MSSPRPAANANFDAEAIERAELALRALSINFQDWMHGEVERLEAARATAHQHGFSDETLSLLHLRAHDVKGLGSTYDYPLVTAIAAQLCRLLEGPESRAAIHDARPLIDAHIIAIRAIVRDRLTGADDPTGRALIAELKARVDRRAAPE